VSGRSLAFEACRRITRERARSFYFASHVLPAERRSAAYAVYAFCRSADDAVDEAADLVQARLQLVAAGRRLDAIYAGNVADPEHPDAALAEVVTRYGVERQAFDELLVGMAQDLEPVRFRTTEELLVYCHRAAGVVGHLMLPVLGAEGAEARARAADLGVAMQLTNILRDVGEDLGRGRIYLPGDELAAYGLTHADVEAKRLGPAWETFMAAQVERARAYYTRADAGIGLIRTFGGRLCARVMRAVYGDILREIEAGGYDTLSRRHATGLGRKLSLLVLALFGRVPPSGRALLLPAQADGPLALPPDSRVIEASHG
jgi:phytoene synthase